MRFWRALKGASIWTRALRAERKQHYDEALRLVMKMERLLPPKPWQEAFKAMLLVRTGKTEAAHRLFADVREHLKSATDADSQYIRRYVQSWLAMLRTDRFQARHEDREATKIDCDPVLKRWLWLPGEPPEDPFDVEFDAWLNANHPDDD